MPRLVVNPGTAGAWEIQLKPGTNRVGRGVANDFTIAEPSVSGSHCQIVLDDGRAVIRDLGSTNGTYINRAPVQEAVLQTGQTVHLGGVAMVYYDDGPAPLTIAKAESAPPPLIPPPLIPPAAAAVPATGAQNCKFHPKIPARYYCNQCRRFFCELCVTSRTVGGVQHKTCRHCGIECVPLQVQVTRPAGSRGFFVRLPGAFIYPFRGSGVFVLLVATVVLAALGFISAGFLAIFAKIVFYGYLFSFMQTIIHSTASEDEEMPGMPGLDDILGSFVRLAGCVLISFGAAIALFAVAFFHEEPMAGIAIIPAVIFGCLYFPMALLAVAMKDTVFAANPLVVVPAIFKVPLAYLVTVVLLGCVFAVNSLGSMVAHVMAFDTLTSKEMSHFFIGAGLQALWAFIKVYLLAVNMRILGLLYVTKKQKLGWFAH